MGVVTIMFDKPMNIPSNISMLKINETLTFELLKGNSYDNEDYVAKIIDWDVIDMFSNSLVIQLYFNDPLLVSNT